MTALGGPLRQSRPLLPAGRPVTGSRRPRGEDPIRRGIVPTKTPAKHRDWIERGDPAGLRALLLDGIERSLEQGRLDGPKRSTARFRKHFTAVIANIGLDPDLTDADRARCLRILARMQEAVKKPDPGVDFNRAVIPREGAPYHPPVRQREKPRARQTKRRPAM